MLQQFSRSLDSSSDDSSDEYGCNSSDDQSGNFMHGRLHIYQLNSFLNEGAFGKVLECVNLSTGETVAMKIVPKRLVWDGEREVAMLQKLRKLDSDKNNLIRFIEHFKDHHGRVCMVFEMLDMNLHELMEWRCFKPLHLGEIRIITKQILVALKALKSIKLIHADIKPNNIMLVNHRSEPFRVKLIDFGLALPTAKLSQGDTIQVPGYRAPEVMLGLPMDEAVDMWAFGSVLTNLYLGIELYPASSVHDTMRTIVHLHGQPDDHLLDKGLYTTAFFKRGHNSNWTLETHGVRRVNVPKLCFKNLPRVRRGGTHSTEYNDTPVFLDLLKSMLVVDPARRITPRKALEHRFFSERQPPGRVAGKDTEDSENSGDPVTCCARTRKFFSRIFRSMRCTKGVSEE